MITCSIVKLQNITKGVWNIQIVTEYNIDGNFGDPIFPFLYYLNVETTRFGQSTSQI